MFTRMRSVAWLFAAVSLVLPVICAPAAAAQPAPRATTVDWRQLGLTDRLNLIGADQLHDVSVPMPAGVTRVLVKGLVGAANNIRRGHIDVRDADGNLVGTVPLPVDRDAAPFSVDTGRARVTDGAIKLSFVLRDENPPLNTCSPVPSVALWQLTSTFLGQSPLPETIADFLPGYLDRVTIRVGPEPGPDTQQAALNLVAALTHRYRPLPVRIDVDTGPMDAPVKNTGTERTIEIRSSAVAGVAVRNGGTPAAVLAVSGSGDELQHQVELFADRRSELTQTAQTRVLGAMTQAPVSTETLTLAELGADRQVSVLHSETMYAGFDAAAFGVGSIQRARVKLRARYTPVTDDSATVVIRSGDSVLATERLNESGTIDTVLDIPAEAISSNVGLVFDLRYFPKMECSPLTDRLFFAIDGTSTVTVERGTHNRGGFPVLPMAFTPVFDVSVDQPADIRYAARVINLLGRETTVLLRPQVRPAEEAAASGNGWLAVTSGEALDGFGLNPPLKPGARNDLTVDSLLRSTNVDPNGPLGFLQAFTQDGRVILDIQTTGESDLLDRGLDYIAGLERQWGSLYGDVVATTPAGETVNLSLREGDWIEPQVIPNEVWKWWLWLTIAVGVVAAVAVTVLLTIRRRRSRG